MATTKKAATRKKAAARKRSASPRKAAAPKHQVTESHKEAMQAGRQQGAAIRRYLDALRIENAPKRRGRRRTPEAMQARIAIINEMLSDGVSDPLTEVQLRQEKLLLTSDMQEREPQSHSEEYKDDFVKAVKPYSERKGIAYDVWREIGVPVVVLREAGMTPGRSS